MRILYDYQTMLNQKYGGVSRYFRQLVDGMNDIDGVDALVPLVKSRNYYFRDYCAQNISIPNRWHVLLNCIETYRVLVSGFFSNNKIDIIHPTYFYPTYLYFWPFWKKNVKVVITVHDLICEKFYHDIDGLDINRRKWMIENADGIIVVSENTKKDLLEVYPSLNPKDIFVVYHGIDIDKFNKTEKIYVENPYFLYVGTRDVYKNSENYIRAIGLFCEKNPNIDFVFAGGGSFSSSEKNLLEDLGVSDKVHQLNVTDEQLHYLYKNALAFVFPSLYEGFGIPIIEAFACECPVLLSNSSCFPEIAGDAAIYFDGKSVNDIYNVMQKILNDEKLRNSLVYKGRIKVKQYSIEKTIKDTLDVYNHILRK